MRRSWRADKLSHLGSSIFAEVAEWKQEALQAGKQVIDLGIGSPDRGPSLTIRETLSSEVMKEEQYSYPGTSGTPEFRSQCAAWMAYRYGVKVNPDSEMLALMGSQDGLSHLAQAICNPGDIAIVPDPGYPIYTGALAIAGVTPWHVPLREERGFLPDLDRIPEEVWEQAVFILLNFPGNPIAAQADLAFFESLVEKAKRHHVLIVHDMAYSEMGFDGYRPVSILQAKGAKEVAVELHSFSKSFNMAGCRVGFLTGNPEAVGSLCEFKNNIDFGVFKPIQSAAIAALKDAMADPEAGNAAASLYESRRDVLVEALAEAGWEVRKPCATMFLWAKLPPAFLQRNQPWSSRAFARELLLKTGVAVIPGDAFGSEGEGFVRIALVQEEHVLREAARRIGSFLSEFA
ncbi:MULTISPECIES: aminotransferase class I/II-fold pyridoxal phosphate-dependent enzyme [Paenibacillus]|uniref:aminotransferase class I/II-fold pyridoxal phosphate-dependent enzyme n=2 Tax=Bacillati TaxID=1783272 RepID=UPI00048A6226|nr:aminotransferase class I/II-fold pyridoxal phosphate-dependent enzyme [Paenibacillus sp. IHBB 10380]